MGVSIGLPVDRVWDGGSDLQAGVKVRWQDYGPSHDTWEPVSSFMPQIDTPFMDYIRKHRTKLHVLDLAALTRAIAARGA